MGERVSDNRKFVPEAEAGGLTTEKKKNKVENTRYKKQKVILQRGRKIDGKFIGGFWLIPCPCEWV